MAHAKRLAGFRRSLQVSGLALLVVMGCGKGKGGSGDDGASGSGGSGAEGGAGGTAGTGGSGGDTELGSWTDLASGSATEGGAGGQAGAGGVEPGAEGVFEPAAWDLNLVVGTGQSLSTGVQGSVASRTQLFDNLTLSLGDAEVPPFDPEDPELSLVPLVEPVHAMALTYPSAYPMNINGETPHTAMSHQISALVDDDSGDDYVTVHSVVGESGQAMLWLDKGAVEQVDGSTSRGRAYPATLFEAEAIERLAREDGKSFGVGAVFLTHGEADAGNTTYQRQMEGLWSDYNTDLGVITGQDQMFPMIVSQQHSVPEGAGSSSVATQAQWWVGVENPGRIVCSGPKYQYAYAGDTVHLRTEGYQMLGEKYGQVYFERVVLGNNWQPLHPIAVRRSRRVIELRFYVPVPPLTWDGLLPSPHETGITEWKQGKGFEVRSNGSPIEIREVELVGDDVVRITTSDDLESSVKVGYAWTSNGEARENGTVRWGRLMDSDPFVGFGSEVNQPNYAVAFEVEVP